MSDTRIAELLLRIDRAFAGIPRPRITHSVAQGLDGEWNVSSERARELSALDPEQSWKEVSDEAIERHQAYFTFSDPEGTQFYLPAHMSHYLRHFPNSAYDAVYWASVSRKNFELLTPDQLECVETFLELAHTGR